MTSCNRVNQRQRWGNSFLMVLMYDLLLACAFNHPISTASDRVVDDEYRRKFISILLPTATLSFTPFQLQAAEIRLDAKQISHGIYDPKLRNYRSISLPNWQGTALSGPLSLSGAYAQLLDKSNPVLTMGKWPDPMLRHPSSRVSASVFQDENQREQLQLVATALKNTARNEGAVGLAAQQCGIDASLIYIDNVWDVGRTNIIPMIDILGEGHNDSRFFNRFIRNNQQEKGIFLVNPRIIQRSPESEMIVWTEQCLVLPPEFRATLLRDAEVTVEYESMDGVTKHLKLKGELARCCQHEMDHDRGVLIVDHVSLDELLTIDGNTLMADIENSDGLHSRRMQRAYSREVSESSLQTSSSQV